MTLVILVLVSLNLTLGENGLISKAEEAKKHQQNAEESDAIAMNTYTEYIQNIFTKRQLEVVANVQYSTSYTITVLANVTNKIPEDGTITYQYYIKLASAPDDDYELKKEGTETTYTYTGLNLYESYMIKIKAINEKGDSGEATITAGTQCFLAGTEVLTESGMKNIEDIKVGEKVYSINIENNKKELKEVTSVFKGESNEVYELMIGNEIVRTTPKHRFYIVDKGWIRAYELEEGDKIVAKDNSNLEITKIEHKFYEEPVTVYNLTVEGYHNYLITQYELLVHNGGSPSA